VVAALDHSEIVAAELARKAGESDEQKTKRWEALIASRVPDVRFLLDYLFSGALSDLEAKPDPARIGLVGHSFGGWTVLAAIEVDRRVRSVVALAPGGASQPRPGILPVTLAFNWERDVPTLYLAAENDVSTPLAGIVEIFDRTPSTKRMLVLRRADHMHFMDNVEELHETVRKMPFPAELAYLQKEMRPITELSSGEQAELFARGLTLCHLDATLKQNAEAQRFLAGDLKAELANRGVEAIAHKS
jgi:dienelactone hydrolase